MKRVFNKAKNQKEARDWDIKQQIAMTPEERFTILDKLQERVYGENRIDIKNAHKK